MQTSIKEIYNKKGYLDHYGGSLVLTLLIIFIVFISILIAGTQGMFSFTEVYNMPIYLRTFYFKRLQKHFKDFSSNDNFTVLIPDMGSSKLGQSYAKRLGMSFALIDKRRNAHNQSEVVSVVGELANKRVLIIDDMIDTAGTISNAAKVAKEKGALSVTVAATHGIFSSNAIDKLSDDIVDSIFITDTIDISHIDNCEKLKTISSSKIFAETINRIHSGESVSQLFRKVT